MNGLRAEGALAKSFEEMGLEVYGGI